MMKKMLVFKRTGILFKGIGYLSFGLVALCYPGQTIQDIAFPVGFLLTLSGLITMGRYLHRSHHLQQLVFRKGVADFMLGMTTLWGVAFQISLLKEVIVVWAVLTGLLLTVLFYRLKENIPFWKFMVISGCFTIVFGLFVAVSMVSSSVSLTYEIATFAILLGGIMLYAYFRLKRMSVQ